MTTTRKEIPFANFLEQTAVKNQISHNIETLLTEQSLANGSGFSYLTRYFNHLPEYSRMKPMLNYLIDAVDSPETFEIWLDIATAIALDDLFDANCNLYPEVANALNIKKSAETEGAWDVILRVLQPKEKIHAYLFCSYMQMYNMNGSKLIAALPDAGSKDLDKNPYLIFSRINQKFKYLEELNKEFIDAHIATLSASLADEKLKFDKIKPYAECQLLISQLKQTLNVKQEDTLLHIQVRVALDLVKEKFYDSNSTFALENIIIILQTLKNSLDDSQTKENIDVCRNIASKIDKLMPGEILKGVALGVGSVVVVLTTITALASFSFITLPALAFSPLIGGGAAATGAVSLGGSVYNGVTFFNRCVGKSSLTLALENVANTANELLQTQHQAKKNI